MRRQALGKIEETGKISYSRGKDGPRDNAWWSITVCWRKIKNIIDRKRQGPYMQSHDSLRHLPSHMISGVARTYDTRGEPWVCGTSQNQHKKDSQTPKNENKNAPTPKKKWGRVARGEPPHARATPLHMMMSDKLKSLPILCIGAKHWLCWSHIRGRGN